MSRPIVVVGAGLAGLVCSLRLANSGKRVALLERATHVGGRARTRERAGFHVNLGPHALYRAGAAHRVLTELGVPIRGAAPPTDAWGLREGRLAGPLPFSPRTALTTPLLTASERWQVARLLGSVAVTSADSLRGTSVAEWLAPLAPRAREVAEALVRVTTYAHAPDLLDAAATVAQLQRALRGVVYLDGGWGSLVDALLARARAAGVDVRTGAAVRAVEPDRVHTDDGPIDAAAVVLCVGPNVAETLTGLQLANSAVPIRASCLDVGLDIVTDATHRFGLGLDRPLYVAVHSDVAALAPGGRTLIHAATYGGGERDELEAALDQLHPGWRDHVLFARWMPDLIVAHDLPGDRAPHEVDGIWLAGDWVGDEGMLADAAVASADTAARAILRREREAA